MRYLFIFCLLVYGFPVLKAQDGLTRHIWQLSGMVVDKVTSQPITYTRIRVNHSRRIALANEQGFYSIPVTRGDTIFLNRLGYFPTMLIVNDYLRAYQGDTNSPYLYVVHYMTEDTLTLPTVTIFPWDTPEKLKTAMLNEDWPDPTEYAYAVENLDPALMHQYMEEMPIDGNELLGTARQIYYSRYQSLNLVPTIGFNPLASVQLLHYMVQKSKEEREKDLNYWEKK